MHAYLIIGQNKAGREKAIATLREQWRTDETSVIVLAKGERSIGIAEVREFRKRLYLAPRKGTVTVGIVEDADTLTIPAQHALLKTLEEPPPNARIILETERSSALLPTILSRCHVLFLGFADSDSSKATTSADMIHRMCTVQPGERLRLLDTAVSSREDAVAWVENGLSACYRSARGQAHPNAAESSFTRLVPSLGGISRSLVTARSQLDANCNWRLVLDNFALSLVWTS